MKNRQITQAGYVLVLTLMIISASLALVTTVYQRYFAYQEVASSLSNREQAKMLALGAIQIGLSQLSLAIPEKDNQDKNQEENPASKSNQVIDTNNNSQNNNKDDNQDQNQDEKKQSPEQQYFSKIISYINRWQTIELTEDITGIDGTLKLYIASENGKINLNQFIKEKKQDKDQDEKSLNLQENSRSKDLESNNKVIDKNNKDNNSKASSDEESSESSESQNKEEKSQPAVIINKLLTEKLQVNIGSKVQDFYNSLGRHLIDPTEILSNTLPEIITNTLFITLNSSNSLNSSDGQAPKNYYFMDLFTTFSNSYKLNPWLLSASMLKLLGFNSLTQDTKKQLLKKFKIDINLQKDFNPIFGSIYGVKEDDINSLLNIFSNTFEVEAFSIVSYATFNNARLGVCAIVERIAKHPNYSKESFVFRIKRLYWL